MSLNSESSDTVVAGVGAVVIVVAVVVVVAGVVGSCTISCIRFP
jgi:hypothetical protein